MLMRDYERAKTLARDLTDEGLAARRSRYDRIGFYLALVALVSFATLVGGGYLFGRFAPELEPSYPRLYLLITLYFPALGIAAFFIFGQLLDRRRGIVDLARRLKQESSEKDGG